MERENSQPIRPINAQPLNVRLAADDSGVLILDQSRLPGELVTLELSSAAQLYEAILKLRVRGAPAIGICAALGLYVLARQQATLERPAFDQALARDGDYLLSCRPTAVNLRYAVERIRRAAASRPKLTPRQLLPWLRQEAIAIQQEDIASCLAIAERGLTLLRPGMGVLTHCNAGALATSRYGTALGPLLLARERGLALRVYADETRPLLQGARLTAWELTQAGIDTTLICDNMAAQVMSKGWVDICFVGCDRVAMNGDTANKIGTSGVAILAKYYGIPFYVLGPTTTIDRQCACGGDIPIEQRPGEEIRSLWYQQPQAPADVACYNPAFDVTEAALISGIITEKGIARPPYESSLAALFS